MSKKERDRHYMRRALGLAEKGEGWANPNPMVGALIVKNGRVIAEGYHKRAGSSHAEIVALRKAGKRAAGGTLYVNLEPCVHFGATPPCAPAIVASGIRRVVFASFDPDPRVRGKGARALRSAGIEVDIGVLRKEADSLNEAFMTFHCKKRPFVCVKFAASLDGKLATRTRDSKWLSGEGARRFSRALRGHYHAILVGIGTVRADDPHLGARIKGKRDPLRIVLDTRLSIPFSSKVLRDSNALLVCTRAAAAQKIQAMQERGVDVIVLPGKTIGIRALLSALHKRRIVSVMVEGGGEVIGSFLDSRLVDKVDIMHGPLLIGGKTAVGIGGIGAARVAQAASLRNVSFRRFGDTMMTTGYLF